MSSEIRKIQTLENGRTFFVGLPKSFISQLGLLKGSYLKVECENERLVMVPVRA
jgi:antitoxin component of MazEF toxin-antitoxin module